MKAVNYILFILLVLIFNSCLNNDKKEALNTLPQKTTPSEACRQSFIKEWTKEVLHPNEMSIKGKILFNLTTDSLLHILGQPDTIYRNNRILGSRIYSFEKKFDYWIYGNTIFGVNEKKESWLIHLDFTSTDVVLETQFIALKKGTGTMEVMQVFPYSSSRIKVSGNLWSGSIAIYATWNGSQDRWLLNFNGQELISVTYIG